MNTFADLQVRANEGDLNSMFALAKIIYYGDSTNNIESNRQEAFSLMRRAADGGHTEAMLATAFSFADGVGVKQDKSMAATYFLRAAESGEQGPMLNLAQLYKRGAFVEKNFVKAQYWLRRAAEIGNVQAKLELGVLFFYGAEGVARDLDEAARWLKSAADDGSVEAMRQMVLVVQPDPDAMREWLQRAADLGDAVSGKLLADQPAATKSTKSDIMSDDVAKQLRGVRVWRQLLADNESSIPPSIISLLPRLVVLLQSQNAKLQLEVAWVLTNVASGPGAATQAVIDAGAMPVLGQLVRSTSDERVREQAIWALGNIFGDSPRSRDLF
jgi:hypothetical protein